jgi:hypothetical protein
MRIFKYLFCVLIVFSFFSCYTQRISLNPDKKSGQISVEYNMDDDYFQLFSIAVDSFNSKAVKAKDKFDPAILLDANAIKKYFKDNKYIKIKSVSVDTSKGYRGKIVGEFSDFERIFESIPKGVGNFSITKNDGNLTLSQLLNLKELDPENVFKNYVMKQKEDDINYYNKLTKEAKFYFYISAPTPIKKNEGVTLSGDKKEASYTFKLSDLLTNDAKTLKFLISL